MRRCAEHDQYQHVGVKLAVDIAVFVEDRFAAAQTVGKIDALYKRENIRKRRLSEHNYRTISSRDVRYSDPPPKIKQKSRKIKQRIIVPLKLCSRRFKQRGASCFTF